MKKYLFFALAVAGMLSSCSQDDSVSSSPNVDNLSDLMPIQLTVGTSAVTSSTRGTGSVGDIETGNNVWANQLINVYMLDKGTTKVATFNGDTIFNNEVFVAQADVNATSANNQVVAKTQDQSVDYYPSQGYFDFWGYRLDGAATAGPSESATQITIPFKIDGSQDVMVAKAVPTAADSAALKLDGNGNPVDAETAAMNVQRAYSAFAARRNVQPNLDFKHMLTRMKFFVVAGNELATNDEAGNKVYVDSIKVMSKATGTLIAAYTGDEVLDQVVFDDEAPLDSLSLKQRVGNDNDNNLDQALVDLVPIPLTWNSAEDHGDTIRVGESLIVAPADSYVLKLSVSQNKRASEDPSLSPEQQVQKLKNTYEVPLTTPSGAAFKRGYSYNITMTVWGFEGIKVSTKLQPWVEDNDADIKMFPEDYDPNTGSF